MTYQDLVYKLLTDCLTVLSACTLACLVRVIRGPSVADRLVGVNMTGTEVIALIGIVAARSGEYGFTDVALVYAMFSFLAGSVLTRFLAGGSKA